MKCRECNAEQPEGVKLEAGQISEGTQAGPLTFSLGVINLASLRVRPRFSLPLAPTFPSPASGSPFVIRILARFLRN